MKKVKLAIVSLAALVGMAVLTPVYVNAAPEDEIKKGVTSVGGAGSGADLGGQIKIVVNILLFILGAIAVIMIVVGGIRYTTSGGDSSGITGAKNTILYAVIGLVVAVMAYAIVNFVLGAFITPPKA
jgi:hypothetical protein